MDVPCTAIIRSYKKQPNLGGSVEINVRRPKEIILPPTAPLDTKEHQVRGQAYLGYFSTGENRYLVLSFFYGDAHAQDRNLHEQSLREAEPEGTPYTFFWIDRVDFRTEWELRPKPRMRLLVSGITQRTFSKIEAIFGDPFTGHRWMYEALLPRRIASAFTFIGDKGLRLWIPI